MRLNRLIDLITDSGVCDDNFGAREIGVIYNLSMMTQVDEIHHTRHMDMRFIEYVEALARVADKAITRRTQEFVGRDPSTSGVAGALDGQTPGGASDKRVTSIKKGQGRGDSQLSRSRSNPRDRSGLASKRSKAPSGIDGKSREMLSDISEPELPIGKEIKHAKADFRLPTTVSAEVLGEVPKFGALDEENAMGKSQQSFNNVKASDDSLIALKPMG